ncbi:MAG TPA: glycosyltransferase [Mucilaginibacter sp.]|jgi:glycosyltransferase involved in cell wall biosynthesis
MKTFPPYHINHIYLNDTIVSPELDVKEKGNYLVFWWKDIALGQFFIEPNKPLSEKEYNEQLANAIRPAIDFYSKNGNITDNEWEYFLIYQMFEEWKSWMNALLTKFTPAKIPASVPVSVIICTRNRASYLRRCLQTLQKLSCLPKEIIVVDNDPADNSSQAVVSEFKGVKYIKEPRGGLSIARNTGVKNAKCEVIAFTDDDAIIHPLWLCRVWETFNDPSIAAMTGLVIASQLDTEAQLIFEKHWSFNRGYVDIIYDSNFFKKTLPAGPPVWEIGAGVNMAFTKSIFDEVGYFDERLGAGASGCSEDSELWFKILAKGYSIYYNPRVIVYHEHRKDLKGLKKQIFYYMRGFTAAALMQQKQVPASGYKNKLKTFPRYYAVLIIKQFPHYPFQFKTLWAETRGILSGLVFYRKHRNRFF